MNKSIKLFLTVLVGMAIAACSNGGSNGAKSAKPKVEVPKAEVPKAEKPLVNDDKTGAMYISDRNGFIRKEDFTGDNLKVLIIDGKEIQIGKDTDIDEIWANTHQNSQDLKLGFGLAEQKYLYFFYNGKPTQEMPISGIAEYRGDYFVKGAKPIQNGPEEQFGKSLIKVNFAEKTLSADLVETRTNSKIKVDGKIVENSFSGSAVSDRFINKVEVEGKFYGKNADEVGGILTDKKQLMGVFSGKK